MRGRQPENWNVNGDRFKRWVGSRAKLLSPAVDLEQPSAKSIAALALLDSGSSPLGYGEIVDEIRRRKVIQTVAHGADSELIPILTLRVALSDLGKSLARSKHRFQLKTAKEGRTARFLLVQPYQTEVFANIAPSLSPKAGHQHEPINDPRAIATKLVQDGGGLPFAALYATYRAAAAWLGFSTKTAIEKKSYESESLNTLGVSTRLGGDRVTVVGLAVGEGLGELQILKDLLKGRKRPLRVDYLAIDSSDILLMSHAKLVTEHFSQEIQNGSLNFVPVVGDLYQLAQHLNREGGLRDGGFLSSKFVICTFFGNCLGNNEQREWDFFKCVFDSFSNGEQVEILVGISLIRYHNERHKRVPIAEKYTLDPFLMETPRHLTYDLELLQSLSKSGSVIPAHKNTEFVFDGKDSRTNDFIPPVDYSTPHGIAGQVYRFVYTLKNDLTTWRRDSVIKAGQPILLYSIIKYDADTLLDFLRARGYSVSAPSSEDETLSIAEGDEEFRYMVFSVLRPTRGK